MDKKRMVSLLAVTIIIMSLFTGCGVRHDKSPNQGGIKPATVAIKIGLVTGEGGINDSSFNQSIYEGITKAAKELGIEQIPAVESKRQDAYEPNLITMSGVSDLTVGCGLMMSQAMANVSKKLINKKFVIVDAIVNSPNTLSITFKEEEGSFLAGVLAGKITKTNKVGFIGGKEGEVINRFESGFIAGVMSVNSESGKLLMPVNAKTPGKNVKYVDSFDDQEKGMEVGKMLYNSGCDIVFHAAGGAGLGLFKAAKEMNKLAIGVDSDQAAALPEYKDVIVFSMEKKVGESVYDAIKDFKDGKFQGGEHKVLGIKEDKVGIAPTINKKVSKEYVELANKYKEAIKEGKFKVPGTRDELKKFRVPQL